MRIIPLQRFLPVQLCLRIVACMSILLPVSLPSLAVENLQIDSLQDISHEVVYVNSFGRWEEGKQAGYFRIVLLDDEGDHPHSKIYLQWIAQVKNADDRIFGSTAVDEINSSGVYKLSVPRINRVSDSHAFVELTAVNQYTSRVHKLTIEPGRVNQYELVFGKEVDDNLVDKAVSDIPLNLDYYARPTF